MSEPDATAETLYTIVRDGLKHLPDSRARATEHYGPEEISRLVRLELEKSGRASDRLLSAIRQGPDLEGFDEADRHAVRDAFMAVVSRITLEAEGSGRAT